MKVDDAVGDCNLKVLTSGSDVYNVISWTREGIIPGCQML